MEYEEDPLISSDEDIITSREFDNLLRFAKKYEMSLILGGGITKKNIDAQIREYHEQLDSKIIAEGKNLREGIDNLNDAWGLR